MKVSFYGRKTFRPISVFIVALLWVLLIALAPPLRAQNESGVRSLSTINWEVRRLWYEPERSRYETSFPILRSTPPLRSDMPLDILVKYIITDSLMRSTDRWQVDAMLKKWTTLNDTLTWALQSLYTLTDYNPILFNQYHVETFFHQRSLAAPQTNRTGGIKLGIRDSSGRLTEVPNGPSGAQAKFTNELDYVRSRLARKLRQLSPDSSERNALFSLLEADYILRVKVLAIDSKPDPLGFTNEFRQDRIYRVIAQVLDTIKGQVYQPFSYGSLNRKEGSSAQTQQYPLLAFEYINRLRTYEEHYDESWYNTPELALLDSNEDFALHLGQEAVVFIAMSNFSIDSLHDYFDLQLTPRASLLALPIQNGMVRDVNQVWSKTLMLPYADWRRRVEQLIGKIKSRNY